MYFHHSNTAVYCESDGKFVRIFMVESMREGLKPRNAPETELLPLNRQIPGTNFRPSTMLRVLSGRLLLALGVIPPRDTVRWLMPDIIRYLLLHPTLGVETNILYVKVLINGRETKDP